MHPPFEPAPPRSPLATELAVRFVERESAGLAAALRAPCDSQALHEALRWHDDAHRTWLTLLAVGDRAGWSSVPSLHRLYAFHGRLAEMLQRGCARDEAARRLLGAHLDQLTSEAVAGLRADVHSQPDSEGRWEPPREDAWGPNPIRHDGQDMTARLGTVSDTGTQQSPGAAHDGSHRP